jgi:hypothetical protein
MQQIPCINSSSRRKGFFLLTVDHCCHSSAHCPPPGVRLCQIPIEEGRKVYFKQPFRGTCSHHEKANSQNCRVSQAQEQKRRCETVETEKKIRKRGTARRYRKASFSSTRHRAHKQSAKSQTKSNKNAPKKIMYACYSIPLPVCSHA